MEPWIFDSGGINFEKDIRESLLINARIEAYLKIGDHDKMLFLVGPKGIGKTLFLSYKSYLYRNSNQAGAKFSPTVELCENLYTLFSQFSREEIERFKDRLIWEKIWLFVLHCVACKTAGIEIEKILQLPNLDCSKVSNVLTFLLGDRKKIHRIIDTTFPKLSTYTSKIQHGVYIFLDGLDLAVDSLIDSKIYDKDIYQNSSLEVWRNLNVSFIRSVYVMNRFNNHIKIFTSLRAEVFKVIPQGMGFNFENYSTYLSYTKNELEQIFEKNISLMAKERLTNLRIESLIGSFLGFDEMAHPFAKNIKEKSFDFLLRHTLERPREIVMMGNRLYYDRIYRKDYKLLSDDEKIEEIRFYVNNICEDILRNYMSEIINGFDEERLVKFLKTIQSNIFSSDILDQDSKEFMRICYNYGLIGTIKEITSVNQNRKYIQHFKNAGDYAYDHLNDIPLSEYYVTHPILDNYFMKIFGLDFYNRVNIIGGGYNFIKPKYLYEYALSYSSADTSYVQIIANELKNKGNRLYFDKFEEENNVGVDLIEHLYKVYNKLAKKIIVFISLNYLKSNWTMLEFDAVKKKLLKDRNSNFLILIRIDNAEIPEIVDHLSYIDASKKSPEDIVKMLSN